jgi:hypothetical protein
MLCDGTSESAGKGIVLLICGTRMTIGFYCFYDPMTCFDGVVVAAGTRTVRGASVSPAE